MSKHCDDYIDDDTTPAPLRVWLEWARQAEADRIAARVVKRRKANP